MLGKIHFLNTGHSDCIILESDGHIAMIDAAEDTDFPADKPNLNLPGYEDEVVRYLIDNFADENGKVNIDFVLGTHCHSDHIGGFDTVINHPDISVKTAYLKPYNEDDIFIMERKRWDNTEVYTQMLDAIKQNNVELIESFDDRERSLGDFKIHFYNGSYKKRKRKFGENINSVVTLVTLGNKKALLVGDLNYKDGDEKIIADKVGKVDILKVGHHGYFGSTSHYFAKKLSPDYSVICNSMNRVYPDVRIKLMKTAKSSIICTADCNGVIAELSDNDIKFKRNIM
ncbi:MAG: MBL fold metallo-hydrolase [Eubacteriales bacterium]|nr:MBL fold metallo-hydrolase [Eubacteriales bacterium]